MKKADDIFKNLGYKKLEWKDEFGNVHTVTYSKSDRHIAIYVQEPVLFKVENRFEKVKATEIEEKAIKQKIKELKSKKGADTNGSKN